jgi:hypothetical protein
VLAILLSTILGPLCLRKVPALFPYHAINDNDDHVVDDDDIMKADIEVHDDENNDPTTPTVSKAMLSPRIKVVEETNESQ